MEPQIHADKRGLKMRSHAKAQSPQRKNSLTTDGTDNTDEWEPRRTSFLTFGPGLALPHAAGKRQRITPDLLALG
jgi:hypothetical protein